MLTFHRLHGRAFSYTNYGWGFFNLIFRVSFPVKMEAVYVTSVHISLGDSLLWPASFRSSWKNTALKMQIRLFIPAKLSTALTSLLVILWICLLEKHKQQFFVDINSCSDCCKSSSWLLWATGSTWDQVPQDRGMSRSWSALGTTSVLCCRDTWFRVMYGRCQKLATLQYLISSLQTHNNKL